MMMVLISSPDMVRRTITLPESTDALVRANAGDGESFSAAVTRLIEAGVHSLDQPPSWVASFDGPEDLGINAERYLRELDWDT
jgi:hypothetical protein